MHLQIHLIHNQNITTSAKTCCYHAGGAISNMYSVMIARYKFFPEVKTKGMAAAPRLVLFTSEHVGPTLYHTLSNTIISRLNPT